MAMEMDGDNETATRSSNVPRNEQHGAPQHFHMTPRVRELREHRSDPGSTSTSPRTEVRTEMMIIAGSPRQVVLPRSANSPNSRDDGERVMKSPRIGDRRGSSAVAQEMVALPESNSVPVSSEASWQQVSVASIGWGGHGLKDATSTRLHDGGSGEASHSNPGTDKTEETRSPRQPYGGGQSSSEARRVNVQAFEESGRLCAAITNGARCALKGEE